MAHAVHAATSPAAARIGSGRLLETIASATFVHRLRDSGSAHMDLGRPIVMDAPRRHAPGFVDLVLLRGKRSENACTAGSGLINEPLSRRLGHWCACQMGMSASLPPPGFTVR